LNEAPGKRWNLLFVAPGGRQIYVEPDKKTFRLFYAEPSSPPRELHVPLP
jgi:hypothetical protein